MRRDMSNFRYEVMKVLKVQDSGNVDIRTNMAALDSQLRDTNKRVEDVAATCHNLEETLLGEIRDCLSQTNNNLSRMEEKVRSAKDDAHNYEASMNKKLAAMESTFAAERGSPEAVTSTLNDMGEMLRHLVNEVTYIKRNMTTMKSNTEAMATETEYTQSVAAATDTLEKKSRWPRWKGKALKDAKLAN